MFDRAWNVSFLTLVLVSACGLDEPVEFYPSEPSGGGGSLSRGTDTQAAGDASASARAPDHGADASLPVQPANINHACPCTRRPEGEPSRLCPWGTGTYAAEVLGPTGGVVQIRGTASTRGAPAAASIPGAALAEETSVVLTELTTPPPAGFVDYSPVYALEPLTLKLQAPGEIALPAGNVYGIVPSVLSVYVASSPEGPFTRVADSYLNAGFVQATLLHGGYYFVGYPEAEYPRQCP